MESTQGIIGSLDKDGQEILICPGGPEHFALFVPGGIVLRRRSRSSRIAMGVAGTVVTIGTFIVFSLTRNSEESNHLTRGSAWPIYAILAIGVLGFIIAGFTNRRARRNLEAQLIRGESAGPPHVWIPREALSSAKCSWGSDGLIYNKWISFEVEKQTVVLRLLTTHAVNEFRGFCRLLLGDQTFGGDWSVVFPELNELEKNNAK